MNIVVVGAGDVGQHIASILSKEQTNVILVDRNPASLDQVSRDLDVATRVGEATDWQLLDDMLEMAPTLLVAVTDDDEVNLVTCAIGKNLMG